MSAIEIQEQVNSNYYLNLVSFTFLFYDYFLTLDWEVSRYWGSALTAPNGLFYLNRYGTLFGTIPVVVKYFWTTESTPHKIASYHQYFAVVTQIIVGVMLILRTHALYERNRRILVLMVCVSAAVIGVGLWAILSGSSVDADEDTTDLHLYIGCPSTVSSSQTRRLAAAWGGMGVFDCTIFFLTLYRALTRWRSSDVNLLTVLIRDGSIYFGVIAMSNLANILTFLLGGPYTRGIATTFTNVISSIMIPRLMLNLRDPSLSSVSGRLSESATLTGDGIFSTYLPTTPGEQGMTVNHTDIELQDRVYP
ncbi:hypothetical protein B0H11DRAFT_2231460 [Mycena galericulata]|nr:hypothetical protein B0H11DRAFT_2231460 [Mycena galericulata]